MALAPNTQLKIERTENLPALPAVTLRVTELLQDSKSSAKEIADLLRQDQSLTVRILKLANSSYYAIPGGCKDVSRALSFLGFNTIAQLVLGLSVFSAFDKLGCSELKLIDFWKHALAVAVGTELLARELKCGNPEEAFTCGLLHDMGKLVLDRIEPQALNLVLDQAKAEQETFSDVETRLGFVGHEILGSKLAEHWGLPQMISHSILHHHLDLESISKLSQLDLNSRRLVSFVNLNNEWARESEQGHSGNFSKRFRSLTELSRQFQALELSHLNEERLKQLKQNVFKAFGRVEGLIHAFR